jgi:hypothetical protein
MSKFKIQTKDYGAVYVEADKAFFDVQLYFYKDNTIVACFKEWEFYTVEPPAQVPYCNPIGRA